MFATMFDTSWVYLRCELTVQSVPLSVNWCFLSEEGTTPALPSLCSEKIPARNYYNNSALSSPLFGKQKIEDGEYHTLSSHYLADDGYTAFIMDLSFPTVLWLIAVM